MLKQITSLQHPAIKHLVKLRQNRDYRYDHHSLVIEGSKVIAELGRDAPLKLLMTTDETLIPKGVCADQVLIVSEEILHKASGMQNSEGILGEIAMPRPTPFKGIKTLLALDGINDPGNLGTLQRTALALGWEGVFLLNESCDPYNEKALRAARGATFRLPYNTGSWHDLWAIAKENQLTPLVADLEGKDPGNFKKEERILLILSNEARGPSEEALKDAAKVTLPMTGKMESLNVAVAGGILMYALRNHD